MRRALLPTAVVSLCVALASPVAACPLAQQQSCYAAPQYQAVPVQQVTSYAAAAVLYPQVQAAQLQLSYVPIQAAPQFYAAPAVQAAPAYAVPQVQRQVVRQQFVPAKAVKQFAPAQSFASPAYAAPVLAAPAVAVPAVNVQQSVNVQQPAQQQRRGLFSRFRR